MAALNWNMDHASHCQFNDTRTLSTPFSGLGVIDAGSVTSSRHSHITWRRHFSLQGKSSTWTSTLVLGHPINQCVTSLDKTSDGFDWLGTLSIQAIKSRASSEEHTKRMIRFIFSLSDLHLIKHACAAWLSVKTTRCLPFKKLLNT